MSSCEPFDDDKISTSNGGASFDGSKLKQHSSNNFTCCPIATIETNSSSSFQNTTAAAVWNFQSNTANDDDDEYLNDIYFEEEEKVYEDLCYVTFSSNLSEVRSYDDEKDINWNLSLHIF